MIMKRTQLVITISAVLISALNCNPAFGNRVTGHEPAHRAQLKKMSLSNWDCSRPEKKEADFFLQVGFFLTEEGNIYNPEISHQFVSDQEAAECVEAVLDAAPIIVTEPLRGQLWIDSVPFLKSDKPAFAGDDIRKYFAQHNQPETSEDVWIVAHRIPLSILRKYPSIFRAEELLNVNNLVQVPTGVKERRDNNGNYETGLQPQYVRRLAAMHAYWHRIFSEHAKLTKDEILQYAAKVPF